MKLSGLILVKDHIRTIRYALESLYQYVDEIVIIDSGSTDGTLDVARRYTDRIFFREWDNNYGNQKQFGLGKCRGEWVFTLDADEVVGRNFPAALQFLDGKYRTMTLPRYHIINIDNMAYITTEPHFRNWQLRFIKNDGISYYYGDPVHHPLKNYRPRLRCSLANIFHLDFLVNDYSSRRKKVDYYDKQYPGAGYPRMYLFEDFSYNTARTLELPDDNILRMLQQDKDFLRYPEYTSRWVQWEQEMQYQARAILTKSRAKLGI